MLRMEVPAGPEDVLPPALRPLYLERVVALLFPATQRARSAGTRSRYRGIEILVQGSLQVAEAPSHLSALARIRVARDSHTLHCISSYFMCRSGCIELHCRVRRVKSSLYSSAWAVQVLFTFRGDCLFDSRLAIA